MSSSVDGSSQITGTTRVSTEGTTTVSVENFLLQHSNNVSSTHHANQVSNFREPSVSGGSSQVDQDQESVHDPSDESYGESPSLSSAIFDHEPRQQAKKRRKQSNPTRLYGNQAPSVLTEAATVAAMTFLSEEAEEDEALLTTDHGGVTVKEQHLRRKISSSKRQYLCSHCSCPFANDEQLKAHIEEEHVQKLLERQLLHQQHQYQSKATNGGGGGGGGLGSSALSLRQAAVAGGLDLSMMMKLEHQRPRSRDDTSSGGGGDSCSSGSPQPPSGRESSPLPQGSDVQQHHQLVAKDFSNMLPFHLPNMPPLMPLSRDAGGKHCGGGGQGQQMAMGMFSNPMAPFLFPVLPQQGSGGGPGNSPISAMSNGGSGGSVPTLGGGFRIFNPEAYCELCNKEFCNKYFLKTHKANKHGIYSMDTPVTTSNGGQGPGVYASTPTSAAAAAAFFPAGLTNTSNTSLQILQQATSAGGGGLGALDTSQMTGMIARTAGMINLESYCEICQKEFCNKYFLKKHRQKIHGILEPGQQPGSNESVKTPNSPRSPVASTGCPGGGNDKSSGDLACEVCKLEFPNILVLQTHKISAHGIPPLPSMQGMLAASTQFQTMAAQLQQQAEAQMNSAASQGRPVGPQPPSSMGELGNVVFTPERLREMGVINADAFCEICCKEFCNKYFLRTHKMNKHGMAMDSNSSCGSNKSNSAHQPSDRLQGGQGSRDPDGGEGMSPRSPGNNDDSGLEPGQREPNANFFADFAGGSGTGGELNCDICSRPFSSNYLLKMHRFYSHNVPYVKEEDMQKASLAGSPTNDGQQGGDRCSDRNGGETNHQRQNSSAEPENLSRDTTRPQSREQQAADQASQNLQKLQSMIKELNATAYLERAICSLCRQEFENKYFLRVHMINDHAMIPSDEPNFEPGGLMRSIFDPSRVGAFPVLGAAQSMIGVVAQGAACNTESEAYCEICQKEFCSKYFLKSHKQNVHGIAYDSAPPTPPQAALPVPPSADQPMSMSNGGKKERPSKGSRGSGGGGGGGGQLQTAAIPTNLTTPPKLPPVPVTAIGPDGKPRVITGRNYCNICTKELCNKYFMKTHMLKMHGINIDEHPAEAAVTSTIGGVTCDICQKELCSKYFLKVHKQNTHGIYEEPAQPKEPRGGGGGASNANSDHHHPHPHQQHRHEPERDTTIPSLSLSKEPAQPKEPVQAKEPSQPKEPRGGSGGGSNASSDHHHHQPEREPRDTTIPSQGLDANDTNNRYFSHYTEICTLCDRRFKSIKWLKTHMINDHMPQSPSSGGTFIMQPFLITQPESGSESSSLSVTKKNDNFVPSIVYLPVSQKVLQPVTVAFQLTPA